VAAAAPSPVVAAAPSPVVAAAPSSAAAAAVVGSPFFDWKIAASLVAGGTAHVALVERTEMIVEQRKMKRILQLKTIIEKKSLLSDSY